MRGVRRLPLLALAGLSVIAIGAVAAGAATLRWSAPVAIDSPPATATHAITAMSCPSPSLCVAGDGHGDILTATNPSGGTSAWRATREVDPPDAIAGISCPTTRLCVAAGADGDIVSSTNPTGPRSSWKLAPAVVPRGAGFAAISCASPRLCVAADKSGHLLTSTHPTGGAHAWRRATAAGLPRHDWLASVACPSSGLCVAIDALGQHVVHSTGPGTPWIATKIRTPRTATFSPPAIACPAVKLCVIVGNSSDLVASFTAVSTRPGAGSSAWKVTHNVHGGGGYLTSITCPSTRLCLADGDPYDGAVTFTTDPTAGASGWRGSYVPTATDGTTGIVCPSTALCVGYDPDGDVFTSATPQLATGWTLATVDAVNELDAVSCPTSGFCVAGGTGGRLLSTSTPAGGTWSAATIGVSPTTIDCPTVALCVAAGTDGNVAASTNPGAGATAWTDAGTGALGPDGSEGVGRLSCPSVSLCIVPDYQVQSESDLEITGVLSSTAPAGGTAAWTLTDGWIDGGVNGGPKPGDGAVTAVSCASASICVGVDDGGRVLTSTTPTNARTWKRRHIDGTTAFTGISCPAVTFCAAVDSAGNVATSTSPLGGTWKLSRIDPRAGLGAISCPSTAMCVAIDGAGDAFVSTHPGAGASAWTRTSGIDGGLTALSCPTTSFCVAVDSDGGAVTASSRSGPA